VILLLVVLVAVAGPWLYDADPFEIRAAPLTPPGTADAWLGSDYLGRDVLTMLVYGGRATLWVGAVAAWPKLARPFGHVAYVTGLHDDGTFDVAEYNRPGDRSNRFRFDIRTHVEREGASFIDVPERG